MPSLAGRVRPARDTAGSRRRRVLAGPVAAVVLLTTLAACGESTAPEPEETGPCSPGAEVDPGDSSHQLEVDGVERTFHVNVPVAYRPDRESPVVMLLHGGGQDARSFAATSRMLEESDRRGFLLVAPQAQGEERYFDFLRPIDEPGSDLAMIDAVMDEVEQTWCVDTEREYLAGYSLGSATAFTVACDATPRFAAYAGSSGILGAEACEDAPPVPLAYFHGTEDQVIPFDGLDEDELADRVSVPGLEEVPAVIPALESWAQHSGCEDEPVTSTLTSDVEMYRWSECTGDADVVAYGIRGGGHQWPGGDPSGASEVNGRQTQTINAASLIWKFFSPRTLDLRGVEANAGNGA